MFTREKKSYCGNYMEVDIIPMTEKAEMATKGKRGKKKKVSVPKQTDLNDKNSKRYLVLLGNGNFGRGDLHTTLTYDEQNLPQTVEDAEREVTNYLRRIDYRRNKLSLEKLKYILVTEYKFEKDGQSIKRIHHHIIMNGGMDRDEVEAMWTKQRINWKRWKADDAYRDGIKQIGYANADRLQVNENGIEALCKYIVKDPQGKKRYSSSRNLIRPEVERKDNKPAETAKESQWKHSKNLIMPEEKCNDFKYNRKKVEKLAKSADAGLAEFKKIYSNYDIVSVEPVYYETTGWHIYLKMWKKCGQSVDKKKKGR